MRLFISISCVLFIFLGCKDTSSTINPVDTTLNDSTFTDIRDYRKYTIVKIGKQVWMSKNLNVSKYRNGDTIRHARTPEEWRDAASKGEGAWCYFNHDPMNEEIFGKLYNWYCVKDARGLAPFGYHIPSDLEWSVLSEYLGGEEIAGFKMKSVTGWSSSGGDNSSGFNGKPGGLCHDNGTFGSMTVDGFWWSSSESDNYECWFTNLRYDKDRLMKSMTLKGIGLSVRCLRD